MPQKWKTVRIFISSTFRDMHAERDHLVRFVFPELKEKCRQQRVHLIDVDLRWGVTEADAQDGKALDICLDEIDSCRPYFLGLLGHRYGWIPSGEQQSITAQEIYHGVLHNDIPRQVVDLAKIIEGKLEGRSLTPEQVNCLVGCYRWDADKSKYILKEDVAEAELSMIRSVFEHYSAYQRNRSFFFFRSEDLSRKLAGSNSENFFESDSAVQNKLSVLKQEIIDAGLPCFEYDEIEVFGEKIGETLWQRIEAEIGQVVEEEKDWLEEEAEFHELFAADRTRRFVGRRNVLERMRGFCEQDGEPSVMVITGEPGCGKSALMARYSEEITHHHPDWLIIPHFVGASPGSTNLRQTLRRLCTHLSRNIESPDEVPEDIKELIQIFPELLAQATEQKRIVMILDAVNQFEKTDNAHAMRWLPANLPENVRFVISTLAGEPLDALLIRRPQPEKEEVSGLNEPELKELVRDYLQEIRREFPNKQVEQSFFSKVKAGNPLYVLVALEELRVFGDFEQLPRRIDSLPDAVPTLFDQVLERIESDFNPDLVRDCMSYIACGKQGMTSEELQTLLIAHACQLETGGEPEKLPDMLWACLYRSFGAYLFERSGVIDFFHGQLKEAVGKRYLEKEADRNATHKIIADYFDNRWRETYIRALDELPHQRVKAEDWDGIEQTLTDLRFIEAKCAAGMTYELILDYQTALDTLPEAQEEKQKESEQEERIKKYTEEMIAYAKAWSEARNQDATDPDYNPMLPKQRDILLPEPISSIEPWSDDKIMENTERIINNPNRLDRLKAFSQFVNAESHGLIKFGSTSDFCIQQAFNLANSGPVTRIAEDIINTEVHDPILLHHPLWRPNFNPHPALLRTLEGHKDKVSSVCITPDGKRAVSGSRDATLRLWDFESGRCIKTLEGHTDEVESVSITPDGKLAVSASSDKSFRLWDLESGRCIKTLEGHTDEVQSVSITPDGKKAVSASSDKTLRVWYPEWGGIKTLRGHTAGVHSVSITPDGKRAVSGGGDGTLRLWDLKSGQCLKTLDGVGGSVSITPDGKKAVSGSPTIRLWDLESGQCLKTLNEGANTVSITPDGKKAVSGGRNLRLWDLESGSGIKTQDGHIDSVHSVSITPDGKRAVSGSKDLTLRLWDLESGQCLKTLDEVGGWVSISPDGKRVVTSSGGLTLWVWDLVSGKSLKTQGGVLYKSLDETIFYEGHTLSITSVSITPDGKRAVSASRDKTLRVWDLASGKSLKTLNGHKDDVECVRITPDGKRAVSASKDETLKVWDLESRWCLKTLEGHTAGVHSLSITPDGKLAVSGSGIFLSGRDNTLRLWDLESGKCLNTLKGHIATSYSLTITPDGKKAVSGGWISFSSKDDTLRLWELKSGQCLKTLKGIGSSISITPDAKWALSSSIDTLWLWDIESGQCIAQYQGPADIVSMSKIKSNGHFAYGTNLGEIISIMPRNFPMEPPIMTPIRLWLYSETGKDGQWDNAIKIQCPWCGKQLPVANRIIDVIKAINRSANLEPDQSPCLELPDEAWGEPRLLSECPICHKPLRYNPFAVDNRERY